MRKSALELVREAERAVTTLSPTEARALLDDPDALFVDLRDVRELEREGRIPGSFHAPRGMLEFWLDPESPYHKPALAGKRLIFYCNKGWRSALAAKTAQELGIPDVAHLGGGLTAWTEAGLETESYNRKPR